MSTVGLFAITTAQLQPDEPSAATPTCRRSSARWRSACSPTSASRPRPSPPPRSATPTSTSRAPRSSARSRRAVVYLLSLIAVFGIVAERGAGRERCAVLHRRRRHGRRHLGRLGRRGLRDRLRLRRPERLDDDLRRDAARRRQRRALPGPLRPALGARRPGLRHRRLDRARLGGGGLRQLGQQRLRRSSTRSSTCPASPPPSPTPSPRSPRSSGASPTAGSVHTPRLVRDVSVAVVALVFSVLFIFYSRNTGDENSWFQEYSPFIMAGVAFLLGIPVYLAQRSRMTEPEPVPRLPADRADAREVSLMTFHVDSEVGAAQAGDRAPAGARAVPPDPAERRRPALRRRHVGRARARGARRLRAEAARQGRHGPPLRRAARRRPSTSRAPATSSQRELTTATRFGPALDGPLRRARRSARRPSRWPRLLVGGVLRKRRPRASTRAPACCWAYLAAERLPAAARCRTTCSSATTRPGSTAACRSTRWPSPRASGRPSTPGRSATSTRCSATPALHFYYGNDDEHHDPANVEGGDILVIGNGAVMVGMGERTTPQGVGVPRPAVLRARRGHHASSSSSCRRRARSCTSTPR